MREKFFTLFPVVTGANERKLRRRERGTERVQTERVRELRPREFQLLRHRQMRPREQSFSLSFRFSDRERRASVFETQRVELQLLKPREMRARELRERDRVFLFGAFWWGDISFIFHFKWNSSLEETSSSSKFSSNCASSVAISGNHPWQIEEDVASLKCNSSLGETSSNWNSSLLPTRRLFPKNVFKQCFFAKQFKK